MTILMVDDNAEILDTTAQFLRDKGLQVVSASSPLGVSALVRRHEPAVLVLDVMMPALDGDALARLLQSQSSTRAPVIIFYSALDEDQLYRLSRQVPGSSYVLKSDGLDTLHAAIRSRMAG